MIVQLASVLAGSGAARDEERDRTRADDLERNEAKVILSKWVMKSTCIRCYQDSEVLMKGRRYIQMKHGTSLTPSSCNDQLPPSKQSKMDFQQEMNVTMYFNRNTVT